MSIAVRFNLGATPQNVISVIESPSDSIWLGKSDVQYFTDRTTPTEQTVRALALSVPHKYLKIVAGDLVEMTIDEKAAVDAAELAALIANMRSAGSAIVDSRDGIGILNRALADIMKDEINALRQWVQDFKNDVSLATTLADLKTRVAANPDMPDRTLTQLKTAIKNRIDSGTVD